MRSKKMLGAVLACLLTLPILLTSCERPPAQETPPPTQSSAQENLPYPVSVAGLTFEESPQSIICLSPFMTEMLYEMGFGERIVGVSEYCDFPAQTADLPTYGSSAKPDLEAILAAQPSLVISQGTLAQKDITAMESSGVKVLILPAPTNLTQLFQSYTSLAVVMAGKLDADDTARAAYTDLDTRIAELTAKDFGIESFVYFTAPNLAVATADTFESAALSLFGTNAANDGSSTDYVFSVEQVLEADPDVLFIASPLEASDFENHAQLSALTAVQEGRIIVLDNLSFERPSTRLLAQFDAIEAAVESLDTPETEDTADSEQ